MKKNKYLSILFGALAVLLSDVMCAAAAYNYCAMEWGARYEGWSAPASTALVLLIPLRRRHRDLCGAVPAVLQEV